MKPIFFLFSILLFLGANFYVFYRIWVVVPPSIVSKVTIISVAVIVILSTILFYSFKETLPVGLGSLLYTIGTSWVFIMLYFFMIFLLENLFGLANRFLHFMPDDALTRFTKDNWLGFGLMVGFVFLLMFSGYLKYNWKVRTHVPITFDKSVNDSTSFRSLRIVAISDMHMGYGIGKNEIENWFELINRENPDIILIAGDLIDVSIHPLIEGNYAESFKKLNAPMGVYACLGNHEYLSGLDKSLEFITQTGIKLLRDSVAEIDSSFYIVGRDDKSNPRRKSIHQLVSSLDRSKPIILLDHQPFHLEEAEENGIDLQISGHTHKGQVWPISLITSKLYEKDHGYLKKGNSNYYISSGIGIWGGKFRIGTQSEYVVIDINKEG